MIETQAQKELVNAIKKSKAFKEVQTSLLSQVDENNKVIVDMVKDYMGLFVTKELLIIDIEERGVQPLTYNMKGLEVNKKNDSVSELTKVNNQMLRILAQLQIKNEIKDEVTYEL